MTSLSNERKALLRTKLNRVFSDLDREIFWTRFHQLSEDQANSLTTIIVDEPEVFVLSGIAGSGKSHVLKLYVFYLTQCLKRKETSMFHKASKCKGNCTPDFKILTPTGISAINVDGMTMDSYLGGFSSVIRKNKMQKYLKFNPPSGDVRNDFESLFPQLNDLPSKMESFLLVDECFMIHGLLIMCLLVLKKQKPCMRFLFMGDPYQFAPIAATKGWQRDFLTFVKTFTWTHVELYTIMRSSCPFLNILIQALRHAIKFKEPLNRFAILFLNSLSKINNEKAFEKIRGPKMIITQTHAQSIYCNRLYLSGIPGPTTLFKAESSSNIPVSLSKKLNTISTIYLQDFRVYNRLELKVGACVMLTQNTADFKNGTMGVVTEILDDAVRVEVEDSKRITIRRYKFNLEERGFIRQFPIIVARGVNIQKLQGITWKYPLMINFKRFMNLKSLYVCVSRLTTTKDLYFKYLFDECNYGTLFTNKI